MKTIITLIAISAALLFGQIPGFSQNYVPTGATDTIMKVKPRVPVKAYAFDFADVHLKPSVFKDAMEADVAYLKKLEPDRFLSQFRSHAGLEPKGEIYGGWESSGLAGHSLGHYLSACATYYAITNDSDFLKRVNYIVDELAECQAARGTGYVGAIPNEDEVFYKVALGNIKTGGFDLNGAWAPWYTIHKIMAGLMDAYIYCNNGDALKVNRGIADWAGNVLRGLTYEEVQEMLRCEYGGMNEALANTYALTGEKKYLETADRFHDNFVVEPLEAGINPFPGKHSNTNIPKAIASIRQYELTGDPKHKTAGNTAWHAIVHHHTYAPGGNGNYEYFGPEDELNNTLTDANMETCATYNMLKLAEHLFALEPDAAYMDYYERALYNHILASQRREDGMTTYFMPLRMGARKGFGNEFHSFTCCVGTSMENHIKYGKAIYNHGADGSLYVNLFIPSVLDWKKRDAKVTLDTGIPEGHNFTITMSLDEMQEFPVKIRKPYWLKGDYGVKVNNKIFKKTSVNDEGYIVVVHKWKNGDKLDVDFPMDIHQMAMPDNSSRVAFFYGPIVLAGDLGKKEPNPKDGTPVFVTAAKDASKYIKQENNLRFESIGAGEPEQVSFKPFYEFTDNYYSVYWDVFTPGEWKLQKEIYEQEKIAARKLEERTVDILRVGEMQPERDHDFGGENIAVGEDHTRKYRVANNGGNMYFTMKVDAGVKNELILTYWGMDNRGRRFDILINGEKIAQADINKYKESKFHDIVYEIPLELTKDKEEVKVTFHALPKNQAGPVYGVRMVRVEPGR